jgi:hypothetical protein
MPHAPATAASTTHAGRVVKAAAVGRPGFEEGRLWVEAYLPFDPQAFEAFTRRALDLGGGSAGYQAAAAADPELARRALEPIDAHGEAMLAADLEALADRFLVQSRRVDVQHDEKTRAGVHVVGSFVNTPEIASPQFYPGAWVVVLKVEAWTPEFTAIKLGRLNAVSFQAVVTKVPIVVNVAPVPLEP